MIARRKKMLKRGLVLADFIREQKTWALATFGPGLRTRSICNHIRNELIEIEAHPLDLAEWDDVIMLGLEGAWRIGATEEEIEASLWGKLKIVQERKYILPADEDAPMEHDRTAEQPTVTMNRDDRFTLFVLALEQLCNAHHVSLETAAETGVLEVWDRQPFGLADRTYPLSEVKLDNWIRPKPRQDS
jgi:hypothetical protein